MMSLGTSFIGILYQLPTEHVIRSNVSSMLDKINKGETTRKAKKPLPKKLLLTEVAMQVALKRKIKQRGWEEMKPARQQCLCEAAKEKEAYSYGGR